MRIMGKYETWESETFVMQLSHDDLLKLLNLLRRLPPEKSPWDDDRKRFLEMLSETEKRDFGFEKQVTKDY